MIDEEGDMCDRCRERETQRSQAEVWADWDACRANEANWCEDNARVVVTSGDEPPF